MLFVFCLLIMKAGNNYSNQRKSDIDAKKYYTDMVCSRKSQTYCQKSIAYKQFGDYHGHRS